MKDIENNFGSKKKQRRFGRAIISNKPKTIGILKIMTITWAGNVWRSK